VNQSIAEKMAEYYAIKTPITLINALDAPKAFDANANYDLLRQQQFPGIKNNEQN